MQDKCQVEGHQNFAKKGFCIQKNCPHGRFACFQMCSKKQHLGHPIIHLSYMDKESPIYSLAANAKNREQIPEAELVHNEIIKLQQLAQSKQRKINQRINVLNNLIDQNIFSGIRAIEGSFSSKYYEQAIYKLTRQNPSKEQCDRIVRDMWALQSPHLSDLKLVQGYTRAVRTEIQQAFGMVLSNVDQTLDQLRNHIPKCNFFHEDNSKKIIKELMEKANCQKKDQQGSTERSQQTSSLTEKKQQVDDISRESTQTKKYLSKNRNFKRKITQEKSDETRFRLSIRRIFVFLAYLIIPVIIAIAISWTPNQQPTEQIPKLQDAVRVSFEVDTSLAAFKNNWKIDEASKIIERTTSVSFFIPNGQVVSKNELPKTGKYYFEVRCINKFYPSFGIVTNSSRDKECANSEQDQFIRLYSQDGTIYQNGKQLQTVKCTINNGDLVSIFVDKQKAQIHWFVNHHFIASAKLAECFQTKPIYALLTQLSVGMKHQCIE